MTILIAVGLLLAALLVVALFAWAIVAVASFERNPDWQDYEGPRPSDQSWRR